MTDWQEEEEEEEKVEGKSVKDFENPFCCKMEPFGIFVYWSHEAPKGTIEEVSHIYVQLKTTQIQIYAIYTRE